MDLEWNTAYSKRYGSFFNEVIEIGAVKLDEGFNVLDTVSIIVKPQIGKKLRGRTKNLTHITNEDVSSGLIYPEAIAEFSEWLGNGKNTFLTWGDGDIRVLVKNNEYFMDSCRLDFINSYADAQKYCQSFIKTEGSNQIGLSLACEQLGVDADRFSHHRALDDSLMTVECIKKVFDREKLNTYIHPCNEDFRRWLVFKPYYIKDMNNPIVELKSRKCICPICGKPARQIKKWRVVNQSFRSEYHCPRCEKNYRLTVRYKQLFDRIDERQTQTEIKPKPKVKEKKEQI